MKVFLRNIPKVPRLSHETGFNMGLRMCSNNSSYEMIIGHEMIEHDSSKVAHRVIYYICRSIKLIYTYIHIYIYTYIHLYIYTFIHLYTFIHFIHLYIYTFIHLYIYTLYIHACMHACIHTYIHILHYIHI